MPLLNMTQGQLGVDGRREVLSAAGTQSAAPPAQGHGREPDVGRYYDVTRSEQWHHGEVGGISS